MSAVFQVLVENFWKFFVLSDRPAHLSMAITQKPFVRFVERRTFWREVSDGCK